MTVVLTNTIKLRVRQVCVLCVGAVLCICIFVPLSLLFSGQLFLLVAPTKYDARFIAMEIVLDAAAFSVSGAGKNRGQVLLINYSDLYLIVKTCPSLRSF
jgi:hypothetical protein